MMETFGLSAALGVANHPAALRCPQGCGVPAGGTASCGSRGAAGTRRCGRAAGGFGAALLGLSFREWLRDPCSRHAVPSRGSLRSELGAAGIDPAPAPRTGSRRSHDSTEPCCAGASSYGPCASPLRQIHRWQNPKRKMQRLTEASRFRKGAAGSRPSGEAEESRLRARRACVQAEGGSVRGSVVRQFPSSLHLSRGSGTAPQQPFPPAACLEAPAGFLPPAPLREHRLGRFSQSPWLVAR